MTRIAAMEYLKEGIRVRTEMVDRVIQSHPDPPWPPALKKEMMSRNPISAVSGEMMQVSDISGVVSFLIGPDARFINGQTIPIDGGYTIK